MPATYLLCLTKLVHSAENPRSPIDPDLREPSLRLAGALMTRCKHILENVES